MDYLSIPVQLCKYAISRHCVNQLRLYIFLKTKCDGQIKLTNSTIKILAAELQVTARTFKTNLNWLLQHKWITVNSKKSIYRIKSFYALSEKLNFACRKGAIFEPFDFTKFKGFIAAAVITYHMKLKSRYDKRRSGLNLRSPYRNRKRRPAFFSLPHTYLASVLHISKSCARKHRNQAVSDGFLTYYHNFKDLGISFADVSNYKKFCGTETNNIVELRNNIALQLNDNLISFIVIRTKSDFRRKGKKVHR